MEENNKSDEVDNSLDDDEGFADGNSDDDNAADEDQDDDNNDPFDEVIRLPHVSETFRLPPDF